MNLMFDINIDILARCPNCNGILYITKNKQLAESIKRFSDANVFIDSIIRGPKYGIFRFFRYNRKIIDNEMIEKVINIENQIYINDVYIELEKERDRYDDKYIIKCKDFNNEEARQSWYDKIEEISKMI